MLLYVLVKQKEIGPTSPRKVILGPHAVYVLMKSLYLGRTDLYILQKSPYMGRTYPIS